MAGAVTVTVARFRIEAPGVDPGRGRGVFGNSAHVIERKSVGVVRW